MPATHHSRVFLQAGCPSCRPTNSVKALSRYQKGKTNLDFTEARDSEWQWHQLGIMQVCTSLQTDNHASTPPLQHKHTPVYRPFFRDYPGEPVPER